MLSWQVVTFNIRKAIWRSALASLLLLSVPAQAAGTVTTNSEAALLAAMQGGGLVTLAFSGTLTLTNTIVISTYVTLDGSGQAVVISGGNNVRLFVVNPGAGFTNINLGLFSGRQTATNTSNGGVSDTSGGAIYNDRGTVALINSTVSYHTALGGDGEAGSSGAVGGDGGNGSAGRGGAIFNLGGTVVITNSVFMGNSVNGGMGGNGGDAGQSANGRDGGAGGNGGAGSGWAIFNSAGGAVWIFNSTFSSNHVAGAKGGTGGAGSGFLGMNGFNGASGAAMGGSIFNENGTVTIMNCTFYTNTATCAVGNDGKAGSGDRDGVNGTEGSTAFGGGIFNSGGALIVTNGTFVANAVAGGKGGGGGAGGLTGFGGDGGRGGYGGTGQGGGIYNAANGTVTLVNTTFSGNSVSGGTGGIGGARGGFTGKPGENGPNGLESGGALFNESKSLELKNSIVTDSPAGGNAGGTITDAGQNISSDGTLNLTAAGSLNGTDPLLRPLADNGGPTPTMALMPASPAIDAGNDAAAPPADQRNVTRSGQSDIGAYEYTPLLLSVQPLTNNLVMLSWSTNASNAVLESSDSLASATSTNWSRVTSAPVKAADQNTVTVGATNRSGFYRFRAP